MKLGFLRKRGALNPFIFLYMFFRALTRVLLGRQRRDIFLKTQHLTRFSDFLARLRFPENLSTACMVSEVKVRVDNRLHEPAVSSHLLRKRGHLFVDIGACIGYYSFLLHDNFDKILAIEPHPKNAQIIKMAKEKYGYNKVTVLPVAVSDRNGDAKLYFGSHCGAHTLTLKPKSGYLKVKTITLDSLIKNVSVDLIKVDVEGAEWKVLRGAEHIFDKMRSWVIELHDLRRKQEMEEYLSSHNYRYKWLDYNHIFAWRKSR